MKNYSIRRKIAVYSVFLLGFLFAGTQVSAATVNVSTIAALQSAINSAASGDIIVLANGTYSGATINFASGRNGITVRSATPGGVFLTGTVNVTISGNGNTFSGFQITSGSNANWPIEVQGSSNLVTQINIDGYSSQKFIVLSAPGQYNVISYCNFKNKPTTAPIGNLIHIDPDVSLPGYHKIRYCSFRDMPGAGGDNGNECIRISNGATSTYVSRTVVEFNYFNNTGLGDSEVVSIKCRENVLRYNTMTNNMAANFCCRNGDNNIVYGNFFLNSGGIRVKEANNIYCYNNYMENCGDGTVTAPIKYVYVSPNLKNINFFHNTIIGGSPIELDSGATGNTWANNIFKKTSGNIFMGSPSGISWAGNIYQGTLGVTISSGMTSANPQLVLNSSGYYGLASNSPAIDAASASYPAIIDIANIDDDPTLTMDISGQARPASAILKDVGCDEYGVNATLNHPLGLSDVGPSYLGGPGNGNTPPSVSLTAPTNGASFTAPASITLTATATDSDGTITSVGFYNGATLIGSDTTSPYACTWTNVAAGSYTLTALATDNSNAISVSAASVVTVISTNTGGGTTNIYTATDTWVCPANVTSVQVECWGGGGAGGGAQRYPQTGGGARAGGGAGGAYAKVNSYAVTPGNTYYINVGAGGLSVMTDTAMIPGGDSWFNFVNSPSSTILAKGGAGGETVMLQNTTSRFGAGGVGTATGSIGDFVYAGGSGATPTGSSYGGSGGGSGGTGSAGNAGSPDTGIGAVAVTGGGNGGDANPGGATASGQSPTIPPGGGGGGARCASATTGLTGGSGAAGKVVLIYSAGGAPENNAPVFTADPISKAGATEDAAYTGQTLSGSATDADSDPLTYSAVAGPAWLSVAANGALSGTPANADVGVNSWTAQVSDGKGGTDTAILNITVANVNDAPVFTVDPMSKADATEDVAYTGQTLAGSATDVDAGATLTYSKVSGPSWLSVATDGTLSGTPANSDVGANSWTVQVSDGLGGTDTAVLNITVINVNDAPVFTVDPMSRAGATAGTAYTGQTLAGSATDVDAGSVQSYSKVSGPAWLVVATSGALSGTPAAGDVGTNSWTVQVSDGLGGTDTAVLNITVAAAANNPPVFTVDPMSRANATNGSAYTGQTLSGSATDPDAGATLTYSKVSGPTWLSVATSGALTGTPASTNVGANSWTVQVSDGLGGIDTAVLNITVAAAVSTNPPTFVAAGAIAGGTATIAPALPSGLAAGDILLLFVETANQAVSISNTNGGTWAEVTASPQGTGTAAATTATRLTAFWSRYNGTQGAPTVSDSGDHQIARMIAIRGAAASGNPWDVTAGGVEATSDTSASIPGATTTVANTLVVVAVAGSLPDATSTANFSGWANANLTSLTERTDNANTSGNGGSLGVATGVKATAGAYGNTTATHASAAVKGMMSIAIKN